MVTENAPLRARVKDFSGLENGYIVLSASDVQVDGTLNPDAAGNQKFAINAMAVSGTVDASTIGTLRAYLVDGTKVLQRCGQVDIQEPTPDPRITSLTVGGITILAAGTSTIIDENKQLAASIINGDQLTAGFVVLSASNVSVGGTLNPDASGNQKFAANNATISGTVNASTPSTLHAYLVDGTSVLQKCGDIQIVAPQARVDSITAGGTTLTPSDSSKNISDGNLSGTYRAEHMELITNPRIVLSTSLNVAVGSQVTGQYGFNAANGSAQAFNLANIADGSYRLYLIDATSAGGNTGTVVQVMGQVTQAEASDWENVTLKGSAWNAVKTGVSSPVTAAGSYNGGGKATGCALVMKPTKPTVGGTEGNTFGYAALSGNNFSINSTNIDNSNRYWLVACHYDEGFESYRVDAVYDYYFDTPNEG